MEEVRFVLPTRAVVRALVFEGEAPPSLKELRALAAVVLSGGPSHFGKGPTMSSQPISYQTVTTVDLTALDEDGDDVLLTCDADVVAVFASARAFGVAPRFGVPAAAEYSMDFQEMQRMSPGHTAIAVDFPSVARAQVLKMAGVGRMDPAAVWAPGIVPWAAERRGDPDLLRFLLARGADANGKGENGSTAMHIAVTKQNDEMAKILLDAGADANALDNDGQTPLLLAVNQHFATAAYGHRHGPTSTSLLRLLLARGADLNRRGASSTLLHVAVERGDEAMAAMLLDAGANASAVDAKGKAPLHVAFSVPVSGVPQVSESLVRLLLERGADANALDKDGQTPLLLAINQHFSMAAYGYGHGPTSTSLLRLLLAHAADLNRWGASSTPLHIAVEKGDEAMAVVLLDAGSNVNAVDAKWKAPLTIAVSAPNVSDSLVRQLVARGADVNARMGGKSVLALLRANASYIQRGQAVPYGGYSGPQPLQTLDEYLVSKGARVT
jgi:ankyrin repeat protein